MRIFHPIIFVITLAVCSAYFVALAQMPPMGGGGGGGYPPPPGGGSGGGGSGGGATYFTLTVAPNGNGSGTVSGGSISCGAQCTGQFLGGSAITLMATPDTGSIFGGWSGDCAGGSSSCSLTIDANKNITAVFDVDTSGAGEGGSGGGEEDVFDSYPDTGSAYEFELEVLSKKPPKKKKAFLGFLTVGNGRQIFQLPFTGSARGANWRVGGTATDPIAQGTLTGKGSRTGIRVGLYTGSVYAQFDSNKSNWVANYYSESGAQRSELYNGKSGIYQEESSVDADGNARKLGLLLTGKTLFGTYEGGSFFIVDTDALPDAAPGAWTGISIPQGNGPLIPTEKIIELLTKAGIAVRDVFVSVAHAAQSLTPAQIFDRLVAYKKVMNNMQGIQQKFAAFDFNDPNLDYDAVQELVDAYDTDQKKLDYLVIQLGRARLFVRGGDWLSTGGDAAYTLMDEGVDMVPAVLVSQVSGPFDFYTVQTVDEKEKLFAGTCAGRNDVTTGEQVTCALRKPTAAQSKAVLKASEQYLTLASQAHDALGGIESALFAPAE